MSGFDPYRDWLGIRQPARPLNHYELLGVATFTKEPPVISQAADAQMARLEPQLAGPQAEIAHRLAKEIGAASKLLLSPQWRVAYDAKLRQQAAGTPAAPAAAPRQTAPAAAVNMAPVATMPLPQAMPVGMPQGAPMVATPIYQQPATAVHAPIYHQAPAEVLTPGVSSISRRTSRKDSSSGGSYVVAALLLVLAGVGLMAFVQRDKLAAMFAGQPAVTAPPTTQEPAKSQPAAAASSGKSASGVDFARIATSPPPRAEESTGLFGTPDPSFAESDKTTSLKEQRTAPSVPAAASPSAMPDSEMTPAMPAAPPAPSASPSGLLGTVDPSFADVDVSKNLDKQREMQTSTDSSTMPAPATSSPSDVSAAATVPSVTAPPIPPKADEASTVADTLRQARQAMGERIYDTAHYQVGLARAAATTPQSTDAVNRTEQWLKHLDHFWEIVRKGIQKFEVGQVIAVDNLKYEIKTLGPDRVSFWLIRGAGRVPHLRQVTGMSVNMLLLFAEKGLDPLKTEDKVAVAAFLVVDPKGDRPLARQMLKDAAKNGADVDGLLQDLDTLP